MKCQNCSFEVALFSPEWQAQRDSPTKNCPACHQEVETVFGAKPFLVWLLVSCTAISSVIWAFGSSWPMAFASAFVYGMFIALFLSLEMRSVIRSPANEPTVLKKAIHLPAWLSPAPWVRSVGHAIWAIGDLVLMVVLTGLFVPSPWSGFLLTTLGIIGLRQRKVWVSISLKLKLEGSDAFAYSAVLLLVGTCMIIFHYVS